LAVDETKDSKIRTLTLGSQVFYPSHGVATVTGREEREVGGQTQVFYVLELGRGGTLLVPLNNVERAGVRALISSKEARELLVKVATDPQLETKLDFGSRKRRTVLHAEALRSGSAKRYSDILQDLLFRTSDKLSSSERRTFEVVREYFIDEVGAVLNLSQEQMEAKLSSTGS
jgi:CarD family transcriptional regulator